MKRLPKVALVLVAALFATALPRAVAAEGLELSLKRVRRISSVKQGEPFPFKAVVHNTTEVPQRFGVSFEIVPKGLGATPVSFVRWSTYVAPGDRKTFRRDIVSSQYWAQRGDFQVIARLDGGLTRRMAFEVESSPVRVPRVSDVTGELGLGDSAIDMFGPCSWGAGAAWGDVEGDGDWDLFIPRRDDPARLYINDNGSFTDEAVTRGVAGNGSLAIGAVFGDYDNDGDADLYVTVDGVNLLYRNDGTGHFDEVAAAAGVDDDLASQSASWGDYDSDGLLDLYVTNYARCGGGSTFNHHPDRLYHNEGDGTFTDRTDLLHRTGSTSGNGFQAIWIDYDWDGDVDLYLANDFLGPRPTPNYLWRNDGEGEDGQWIFTNVSIPSNTHLLVNAMGIAAGDYDRDLDLDMALSNARPNLLLRNNGDGTFTERARFARIRRPYQDATNVSLTWGAMFGDLNNDGWEDLIMSAGRLGEQVFQPDAVFTNARNGRFLDHSAPAGANDPGTGRGIALADFDEDGGLDWLLVSQEANPTLYRNTTPRRGHWLEVDLRGTTSNADGCGARLDLVVNDRQRQVRQLFCGGTSLSSGAFPVLHFGLGRASSIRRLVVRWPSGIRQVVRSPRVDRSIEVVEAQG